MSMSMEMKTELKSLCDTIFAHRNQQNRNYEFADTCRCLENGIDDINGELMTCHDPERSSELTSQIVYMTQLLANIKTKCPIEWEYFQTHPNMLNEENDDDDNDSYDSYDEF